MSKRFFERVKSYFHNKKIVLPTLISIFVIGFILLAIIAKNSYALWELKAEQKSTNYIEVTEKIRPTIKKVEEYQDTEIWKYKSSITKVVFENSIHDVVNSIETFDISASSNKKVIAHIVPNTDDNTTNTVYIQANEKIYANNDSAFLFSSFTKLVGIEGLEYFDTSSTKTMMHMFENCNSLSSLDLSSFNTSQVTDMGSMFYDCNSLSSLDLSNFNTSQVTDMSFMFRGCSSLVELDLSNFKTNNVTNMNAMFSRCTGITKINFSSNFDTSKVQNMADIFARCNSLTSIDLSNFKTNNVTNMGNMFYDCNSLTSLDLSSFNTSKVTKMSFMFRGCSNLIELDLSSFNTAQVTNMNAMFSRCTSLTKINLNSFNTSKVKDMGSMFYNCPSLTTTLNIMNANTTSYASMLELASTTTGSKITLNYTSATSDLVDQMIATKSSSTNAIKGEEIII